MENIRLTLNGFKCYSEASFDLNNLTLLTGANSSGKSSIIQALLLLHTLATQPTRPIAEVLNNKEYALELGEVFDIVYQHAADTVTLTIGGISVSLTDSSSQADITDPEALTPLFANHMHFLCAERLGPRLEVKRIDIKDCFCGCHGQYTAEVIDNNTFTDIAPQRTLDGEEVKLRIALDSWINLIFPGTDIRINHNGDNLQPIIRSNHSPIQSKAPNVGFGISYALPIIVSGLLAREGDWLVIENPEAHLHAKAQSNMGYFLAQMAEEGVRVVAETHSEHVANGIRRFITTTRLLRPEDATIYFLPDSIDNTPLKITIDSDGNLSDFPVDFFDQSRQDMLAIINATSK